MSEPNAPTPAPTPAPSPAPVAAPAPTPPQGPLASYWDAEKGALNLEKLSADWAPRDAVYAQHTERAKGIPAKPEEYETKLPEDVKLPEGFQVKFDDTAIAEARTVAHAAGIDKATFSKLLGVVVKDRIAADAAAVAEHQAMVAAEVAKMGGSDAVKARRAPLDTYIAANFNPEEQAELRLLFATEAGTRTVERLIAKANGSAMPGRVPEGNPSPPQKSTEQRWYGEDSPRKVS